MKKVIFCLVSLFLLKMILSEKSYSQVGINTTGAQPHESAMLDVSSTTKGFLPPRMTVNQRDIIASPAEGLIIFNTTTKCIEMYENNTWQEVWCADCLPPVQPSQIYGPSTIYPTYPSGDFYVDNAPGVTYTWTYSGGGCTFYSYANNTVTVLFSPSASSGVLSCVAHNQCGIPSIARQKNITLPFPCVVGTQAGGGTVFAIGNGKCFVATNIDQIVYINGVSWYNGTYTTTGAINSSMGGGQINTSMIMASQGYGIYAAKMCDDLILNDYNDWWLPSISELSLMYCQKNLIGNFSTDPITSWYWSSTEINSSTAQSINFNWGYTSDDTKNLMHSVRCIRSYNSY